MTRRRLKRFICLTILKSIIETSFLGAAYGLYLLIRRMLFIACLLSLAIPLQAHAAMRKATVDSGKPVIIMKWYGDPIPKPVRPYRC